MAKAASKKGEPARTERKSSKAAKSKTASRKAPAGRGKSSPTKDAPWDVDPDNDGDFASPRIDLDENEIKEREDGRG
jgi:hypothetical protein